MDTQSKVACPAGAHTTLNHLRDLLDEHGLLAQESPRPADVPDLPVTGAACDSRCVRAGNVFFCKGAAFKPAYLASALGDGAIAYVCTSERAGELATIAGDVPALVTSDMRKAMALVSAAAFGRPDLDLPMVGITGTKGKSTSAYMLRSIIDVGACTDAGDDQAASSGLGATPRCGIMGSIDTFDGIEDLESTNTTPEAPDLWRHLANAREAGLPAMVMEVSSQALKYDRTLGVSLDIACFLNIGTDHISPAEHPDFEDYFSSKLRIFSQCHNAVVNLGCAHLSRVLDAAAAATGPDGNAPKLLTVSAEGPEPVECGSCDEVFPDIWATDVRALGSSLEFVVHTPTWEAPVSINFPGLFNVENALVAIACAELLGINRNQVVAGLASCQVPGRMELVGKPGDRILCVVDYAHNTLSYRSFFASMEREFPGRRIVALIGAPGNKAYERREELPREAARWASHIVITEEDPGTEPNEAICAEMDANVPEREGLAHEVVLDRQQAVARCLDVALGYGEPALVCLLGKGDETLIHRGHEFQTMVPDAQAWREACAERGLA